MEVNVREKSKKYEPRTSNFDHLREMEGPSHEGWVGSGGWRGKWAGIKGSAKG